jgi:hypothetical protein
VEVQHFAPFCVYEKPNINPTCKFITKQAFNKHLLKRVITKLTMMGEKTVQKIPLDPPLKMRK